MDGVGVDNVLHANYLEAGALNVVAEAVLLRFDYLRLESQAREQWRSWL
jgi:hypothetical protein